MAKSFTVPCPSCEADVLVKNEAMIGKKIDCPKCKYRFKVPDPHAADVAEDGADEAATPAKKKGNPKVLIGVGVGVAALVLLGVVGFLMFSGDDKPKPQPMTQRTTPPGPTPDNATPQPTPATNPGGTTDPVTPMPMGDPNKQVIAPPPIAPPDRNPGENPNPMAVEVPKPVPAGEMKDATNLLPGETQAVLQFNMQRLQPTPFYGAFFDRQMLDFFRNSMSFDATDISHVYVAMVGSTRDPFAIIRTKAPVPSLNTMSQKMEVEAGKQSPITRGRSQYQYGILKTNPFVTAISKALSTESLLAAAGVAVSDEEKAQWKDKPLAICVYDSQTVLIGEVNWMERFLLDLGDNGYPPFQTEMTAPAAPPPADAGAPPAVAPPGSPPPGSPPMPMGSGPPMPMGSGPAGAPPGTPPAKGPPKLYTSVPTYRTVKPELKRMLNLLEEDEKNPPAVVYADMIDKRLLSRDYQSAFAQAGMILGALVENTKMVGVAITSFQKEKLVAQMLFDFVSAEDAKTTVNDRLETLLKLLAPAVSRPLGTPIDVRNTAGPNGATPAAPGSTDGSVPSSAPPGSDGGRGIAPPPGSGPPGSNTAPGTGPIAGFPPGAQPSKIELGVRDTLVTIEAEINWQPEAYLKTIQPVVVTAATQLKGRMSVLSGAARQGDLAAAVKRLTDEKQMAPPATFARNANIERYGLPYPPDHRVSFMADLLPFLGKGGLRQSIDEKKFAWYAKEHEAAAGTWVSEFLVPDYPQTSWRATHPLAEGRSLGGTNYVAVSGLGLDSARYDPANPEHAKKVGMVGYDWGSKPAEVTDGLSNTMYMIQVPPTHARPWIAGGGSTVQGLDDALPNPVDDFVHGNAGGKRGTHVLMGDGSVRFVPEGIDAKVFKAMATRAGGESLGSLDKDAPLIGGPKKEVELKGNVAGAITPKKPEENKKDEAVKAELDKLQGKWKAVKGYSADKGQFMPKQILDALEFRIAGNRLTVTVQGQEVAVEEFTIDPTTDPKQIDSKAVRNPENKDIGKVELGVYQLTDTKLVMKVAPKSAKDRPKDLEVPKEGSKDADYSEFEKVKE